MKPDKNKQPETVDIDPNDIPPNAKLSFDNEGRVVFKNRAFRRQVVSLSPKSSQLRKKGKRKKKK